MVMDHTPTATSLPDDPGQLEALLVASERIIAVHGQQLADRERVVAAYQNTIMAQQATITTLMQQRTSSTWRSCGFKQAHGPRADRLTDAGQLLPDFAQRRDALPIDAADPATHDRPIKRRRDGNVMLGRAGAHLHHRAPAKMCRLR